MNNKQAYNVWAEQYDTNVNRTRDIEANAFRKTASELEFSNVLEIGCGTGKNSEWLVTQATKITAVDFSEEMLSMAKTKVTSANINFIQADITKDWSFANEKYDLITFSLVLEHIQNLDFIFQQVKEKLADGGYVYVGELHPFKQYTGSLARFNKGLERIELKCFIHHISDFIIASANNGLTLHSLNEWFDEDERNGIPRLLTLLFKNDS